MIDSALTVLFLSAEELLRRTSITASWIFKVDLIIQVLIKQLTDYSYKDTPASKLFFLIKNPHTYSGTSSCFPFVTTAHHHCLKDRIYLHFKLLQITQFSDPQAQQNTFQLLSEAKY